MTGSAGRSARLAVWHAVLWVALALAPVAAVAAPSAALVMDARTGQVLYAQNADARLHPASLTKMMTLYVAFEAIRRGEITMDTVVTVSAKAAAEPPSRLGLRPGQRIAMRNLIRAAALKSANDAATAIGEAISGSEAAFARRMTATARALGMNNTTFRNAHGLTAEGHLSTARDMTVLGRRLFYDFPQHYALFSRPTADAGVAQVANTNRRFLDSYRGADGIKTGFTRAAGFNLTASAERGNKRLIATVFGSPSLAHRTARMVELMDAGFGAAPANAATRRPPAVTLPGPEAAPPPVAEVAPPPVAEVVPPRTAGAKTIRLVMTPTRSPRPMPRPEAEAPVLLAEAAPAPAPRPAPPTAASAPLPFALVVEAPDAVADAIEDELREAFAGQAMPPPRPRPADLSSAAAETAEAAAVAVPAAPAPPAPAPPQPMVAAAPEPAVAQVGPPPARPAAIDAAADPAPPPPEAAAPDAPATEIAQAPDDLPEPDLPALADAEPARTVPDPMPLLADAIADAGADSGAADLPGAEFAERDDPDAMPADVMPEPSGIVLTAGGTVLPPPVAAPAAAALPATLRLSTSGARHWGVTLGRFPSRGTAERALLMTGLSEPAILGPTLRKVVARGGGYEATFAGLTPEEADLACRRLVARDVACTPIGP